MIDFRYHIVSLISVFLALAIGIVLGAGPLKEAIGDQLTGQVEALRTDKEQLRSSLTDAETNLGNRDEFLEGVSGDLLAEVLPGRRVAIIELEETPDGVLEMVETRLKAAGATLTTSVQLTESWTSESKATFRKSLASSLVDFLEPQSANEGADADLAAALVQSLTGIAPEDGNALSSGASDIKSLLAASELVEYSGEANTPADMIVLVSSPQEVEQDATPDAVDARAQTVQVQSLLALAASARAESALVASATEDGNDLLARLGSEKQFDHVTTVARVQELPGQLNVPLALAAAAAGEVGRYGAQDQSTGPVPRVVRLGEVDRSSRVASLPEAPEAGDSEGAGDDESNDGDADDATADADASDGSDAERGDAG